MMEIDETTAAAAASNVARNQGRNDPRDPHSDSENSAPKRVRVDPLARNFNGLSMESSPMDAAKKNVERLYESLETTAQDNLSPLVNFHLACFDTYSHRNRKLKEHTDDTEFIPRSCRFHYKAQYSKTAPTNQREKTKALDDKIAESLQEMQKVFRNFTVDAIKINIEDSKINLSKTLSKGIHECIDLYLAIEKKITPEAHAALIRDIIAKQFPSYKQTFGLMNQQAFERLYSLENKIALTRDDGTNPTIILPFQGHRFQAAMESLITSAYINPCKAYEEQAERQYQATAISRHLSRREKEATEAAADQVDFESPVDAETLDAHFQHNYRLQREKERKSELAKAKAASLKKSKNRNGGPQGRGGARKQKEMKQRGPLRTPRNADTAAANSNDTGTKGATKQRQTSRRSSPNRPKPSTARRQTSGSQP
jgi:hypothetical protein